jgi:hypothetical protein
MALTAVITLASPGADTGPLFDLRSNADSYASIFESGVTKSSLLTGYTSTIVPDSATIIRVQSTGTCISYIDFPISGLPAPTTTTTTTFPPGTCTELLYGYDAFYPLAACSAPQAPYYWNGIVLRDPPPIGTTCTGPVALDGYYSDGIDTYYWDGVFFDADVACPPINSTYAIYLRRLSGFGTVNLSVGYATRTGSGAWSSYTLLNSSAVTNTYSLKGTISVLPTEDVLIGVKFTSSITALGSTASDTGSLQYCDWSEIQNYYIPASTYLFHEVFFTADTSGTTYIACAE